MTAGFSDPPALHAASYTVLPLSPLQRVPTELKRQIISHVIPHGLTIIFALRSSHYYWSQNFRWVVEICETDKTEQPISEPPAHNGNPRSAHCAFMSLVRTSKDISTEARALLYSGNEFLFRTKMPMFGGSFGPISPGLLRNIKSIRLAVEKNLFNNKGLSGQRDFFRRFIDVINAHSDDNSQVSLLKQLWIEVKITAEGSRSQYDFEEGELERLTYDSTGLTYGLAGDWSRVVRELMYMLESLTMLPPIDRVTVTGPPEWLTMCLQLSISGRGGALLPLHWRSRRIKNTRDGTPRYKSDRPDDAPSLDWCEFAQRNKIELPDCILELFKKHNARFPRPSLN